MPLDNPPQWFLSLSSLNTFCNPSSFYYFLLLFLLKISLGDSILIRNCLATRGFFTFFDLNGNLRGICYFLKQTLVDWTAAAEVFKMFSGLFTADTQFITPFPERFAADTQLLSQCCFAHILLIFQHKAGEIIFQ